MNCLRHNKRHSREHGVALLLMMMVLFSGSSALFLAAMNNRAPYLDTREEMYRQMQVTREALLTYAMNYADFIATDDEGPGRLPCGSTPPYGIGDCAEPLRLPASLTLPDDSAEFPLNKVFAGTDQQFWLIISDNFAQGTGQQVNTNTDGGYLTNDNPEDIVAVIFAPGPVLSGQNRTGADADNPENFLESANLIGPVYRNGANAESFNDVVLGISRNELMSLVTIKVAQEVHRRLRSHAVYPVDQTDFDTAMAGQAASHSAWFELDAWDNVTDYSYDALSDTAVISFQGCNTVSFTITLPNTLTRTGSGC